MSDENTERKKRPLTRLDLLPLSVGFGRALAMWFAGLVWVVNR